MRVVLSICYIFTFFKVIALDKLIKDKKATDAEIKAALEKLHDRFHEVVGACKNEGEEHEHKSN